MSNKDFGQLLLSAFYESDLNGYLEEIKQYNDDLRHDDKKTFKILILCLIISIFSMFVSTMIMNKFFAGDDTVKSIVNVILIIALLIIFFSLILIIKKSIIKPLSDIKKKSKIKRSMARKNITSYRSVFNFYENGFDFDIPLDRKSFRYKDCLQVYFSDHFFTIVIDAVIYPRGTLIIPLDKIGDASAGTLKRIFKEAIVFSKK